MLCCIVEETLKLMGVPGTMQWAAWIAEYVVVMMVLLLSMAVLLSLPVTIENVTVKNNQTTGYVFTSHGIVDVTVSVGTLLLNCISFAWQMSSLLSIHAQWRCEGGHFIYNSTCLIVSELFLHSNLLIILM